VRMTNAAKAAVWDAVWLPWGGVHAITGSATLDARFPGQWFQLESGLHYNWHRQYDPTIGRYIQADPLGFVDGPSVYGYVDGSPQLFADVDGLNRRRPPIGTPPMNFPVGAGTPRPAQPATQCVRTYTVPDTITRINQGTRDPHRNDGTTFRNDQGRLPPQPPGYYTEYVVGTPNLSGPGPQRLVTGAGGEIYYTPNHYLTFTQIK
jgi:RHS repeat-associated protein